MKLNKQMEEFYNKLNSFVEDFIVGGFDPEEWNQDDEFKKFFVENIPKTPKAKTPKEKDPSEPKKAKSPYIFFSSDQEIRQMIKDENPNSSPTEVMKMIGALWSSEDYKNYHDEGENKDKNGKRFDYTEMASKYLTMAENDKKRYLKEMESYTPDPNISVKKSKKKNHKSAYIYFCNEFRADAKSGLIEKYTGKELQTEVMKCLGKRWNKEYKDYTDKGLYKDKDGSSFNYTEKAQRFLDMANEDKERSLQSSDDELKIKEEEVEDEIVEKKTFKKIKVKSKKVISQSPPSSPPSSHPYIDRGFNGGGDVAYN